MRVAVVGYGRMGRAVESIALERGHDVVARLDRGDPITPATLAGAEIAVEFSTPESAPDNVVRLAEAGVDVVCGTTGWTERMGAVRAAVESSGIGLLTAPNFSLGVAFFVRVVRRSAELAAALPDYDVHLHEAHHRHKVDHPSGTARMLADLVVSVLGRKARWLEAPPAGPPEPGVLYVSVTRAGEIPGVHTLAFEGPDDRIELRHEARDRRAFARGAVEGAEWLHGRAGAYDLEHWLRDRFS